jgi:hypothetical protein
MTRTVAIAPKLNIALCTSLHRIPHIYVQKTATVSLSEEANGFEAYEKTGGPGSNDPEPSNSKIHAALC